MSEIYEAKITKQAQEQLKEIFGYISYELLAHAASNTLLDKMEDSIMKLSSFPERFQLVDEEPWQTEGIRKLVVKNFLVYYWVDKINMKVQVTAVIYERRNQIEQLKKMHIGK